MFVWGLNDKDQLGGLKGSKVRMKETLHKPVVYLSLVLDVQWKLCSCLHAFAPSNPVSVHQMGADASLP